MSWEIMNLKNVYKIARLTDDPAIVSKVAEFLYDGFGKYYENSSINGYTQSLLKKLENDNMPFYMVCFENNNPIGTAGMYEKWGGEETYDLTPWFGALYVIPEKRRNGVGQQLLKAIEKECQKLKINRIYLHTPNQAKLYEKWGWKTIREIELKDRIEKIMEYEIVE